MELSWSWTVNSQQNPELKYTSFLPKQLVSAILVLWQEVNWQTSLGEGRKVLQKFWVPSLEEICEKAEYTLEDKKLNI